MPLIQVDTEHIESMFFAVLISPLADSDVILSDDGVRERILGPFHHMCTCPHEFFAAVLFVEV